MKKRILIADDHPIVRRMLKALLETHEGWKVCCEVENGREAITMAVECKPDLVIMDMAMPLKDGISASREISWAAPTVPIVMHTLHYSPELVLEAKKAGIRAIVAKADSGDELLKTIEGIFEEGTMANGPVSNFKDGGSGLADAGDLTRANGGPSNGDDLEKAKSRGQG